MNIVVKQETQEEQVKKTDLSYLLFKEKLPNVLNREGMVIQTRSIYFVIPNREKKIYYFTKGFVSKFVNKWISRKNSKRIGRYRVSIKFEGNSWVSTSYRPYNQKFSFEKIKEYQFDSDAFTDLDDLNVLEFHIELIDIEDSGSKNNCSCECLLKISSLDQKIENYKLIMSEELNKKVSKEDFDKYLSNIVEQIKKENHKNVSGNVYIITLKCAKKDDCFYIGFSDDVLTRIHHKGDRQNSSLSEWFEKGYKINLIKKDNYVIKSMEYGKFTELIFTVKFIQKYGIERVKGDRFCQWIRKRRDKFENLISFLFMFIESFNLCYNGCFEKLNICNCKCNPKYKITKPDISDENIKLMEEILKEL